MTLLIFWQNGASRRFAFQKINAACERRGLTLEYEKKKVRYVILFLYSSGVSLSDAVVNQRGFTDESHSLNVLQCSTWQQRRLYYIASSKCYIEFVPVMLVPKANFFYFPTA
jgi:hypothetical protein